MQGHDYSGSAEAALRGVEFGQSSLNNIRLRCVAHALDSRDVAAVDKQQRKEEEIHYNKLHELSN